MAHEQRETCPEHLLPAFVILCQIEGQNALSGVVEHSFTMGRNPDRVCIWYSRMGEYDYDIDGKRDAEAYVARDKASNETLIVWDANDPELPITIDWRTWWDDNEFVPKTLSGVRDKFKARNAPFVMKDRN